MGAIVFWTLVRIVFAIPTIWILKSYLDYQLWWFTSFMIIYGVVVHPAIVQYHLFIEQNKDILESTLCSSCKHFDKSAVLCMKYDEHPTKLYLPCEGGSWEPKNIDDIKEEDLF